MASGCSTDFSRFDRNLRAALPQSSEQTAATNPYPGGVDPTTTAAVPNNSPMPLGAVTTRNSAPDHGGYQPSAGYPSGSTYSANAPQPQYGGYQAGAQSNGARSGVVSAALPAPSAGLDPASTQSVQRQGSLQPQSAQSVAIPSANTDTGKPANGVGGWSSAGGTSVTIQPGETLYNLSKRYGVPVKEIMQANNIGNANDIQAGQRVLIPNYVYSRNAPVSAPDNDPGTKAATASRGFAAPDGNGNTAVSGDIYIVQSGDTLSGIASRHGTSVSAIKSINGLNDTTIRVGQAIRVAGDAGAVKAKEPEPSVAVAPKQSETSTVANAESQPKPYVKPAIDQTKTASLQPPAPESSGIEQLRWPVKGRIISSFGEARGGERNDGIDISVPEGTAVKAAENGVVIYSGDELEGFGNLILVRHSGGYVTAYAHNKSNLVGKGETITRGQMIATSGRTGNAQVPMLHFEVRKDSKPVDPVKYLGG